ncbi:hypothetical protein [Paraburkholderia oxyphila]|uniref:hypothetical protein n=1 Tax=Paraburkholderia oxyphila TaxID=614212 RepID=UPI0005BA5583|nr:hypothetical protein [Paraburkholderia oxyphila]
MRGKRMLSLLYRVPIATRRLPIMDEFFNRLFHFQPSLLATLTAAGLALAGRAAEKAPASRGGGAGAALSHS